MGLFDALFGRGPRYKVLIADDSALQVTVFKKALEEMGHVAIVSPSSRDVLPVAVAEQPHLILLDVNMEGLTGIHVLQQLKFEPKTYHIPVLMCTGEITKVTMDRALSLGAVGYVIKPMHAAQLKQKIEELERRKVLKTPS